MLVRLRIDPSGRVRRVEPIEATLDDPAFQRRVFDSIRRWTFGETGGRTVEVIYPFSFVEAS
jgi:outer membrane biosynthesis protein TonB